MSTEIADDLTLHDFAPGRHTLRDDVLAALARPVKELPSQYLYDERGARLFERICEQPEYYPTRTEIDILRQNLAEIRACIGPRAVIIEPGSGSGVKTRLLLESLAAPAAYVPIDVAKEQLAAFAAGINAGLPDLHVAPVCADFTNDYRLPQLPADARRRVVYFPGSTIGNFKPRRAHGLLRRMVRLVGRGGGVLIGVDLKKDRRVLEPAYDDAAGVSAEFALNYLVRLNGELEAEFDIGQFHYEAPYNEHLGRIEMAVVSRRRQRVRVDGRTVDLRAGERLRTEYSYKYGLDDFARLVSDVGLDVARAWVDPDRLFSVQYLRVS